MLVRLLVSTKEPEWMHFPFSITKKLMWIANVFQSQSAYALGNAPRGINGLCGCRDFQEGIKALYTELFRPEFYGVRDIGFASIKSIHVSNMIFTHVHPRSNTLIDDLPQR